MKTEIYEPGTDSLAAPEQMNRMGMAFRATERDVLRLGGQTLPDKTESPQVVVLPDGSELWRLYRQEAGSHADAENALVEFYLPLVRSVLTCLARTLTKNICRDDLQSAGLLGLLDALRKFNPTRGVPFYSYAHLRIRGAMLDEIRRMDWVPRSVHKQSRKCQETVNRLEQQLGRTPNKIETADAMKISVTEYDELLDRIRPIQFICLDSVNNTDWEKESFVCEEIADPDQVDPTEQVSASELNQLILERLKQMPEIQRKVLTLYYLEGLYLWEIGEALGLAESRICQIKIQATDSMRAYLRRYENETTRGCNAAAAREPTAGRKNPIQFQKDSPRGNCPPRWDLDGGMRPDSKFKAAKP